MQIRYLETLNSMANKAGTKVIFMPPNSNELNVQRLTNMEVMGPGGFSDS